MEQGLMIQNKELRYDEDTGILHIEHSIDTMFAEWHAENHPDGKWYLFTDFQDGESRLDSVYDTFEDLYNVAKTWT